MNLIDVENVLILAAHPDDETLGMGGTIHKLSQRGINIDLLTFTDGESARSTGLNKDRTEKVPAVQEILGIKRYNKFYYPDNAMDTVSLLNICRFIEGNIKNKNYHLIFTHHPNCLNVDHTTVYRAALTVFRPSIHNCTILSFYTPSSSDYSTDITLPNFFIPINQENLNKKIQAARIYQSEIKPSPNSRSYANIINLAKTYGAIIGSQYAEGFKFERGIACSWNR